MQPFATASPRDLTRTDQPGTVALLSLYTTVKARRVMSLRFAGLMLGESAMPNNRAGSTSTRTDHSWQTRITQNIVSSERWVMSTGSVHRPDASRYIGHGAIANGHCIEGNPRADEGRIANRPESFILMRGGFPTTS